MIHSTSLMVNCPLCGKEVRDDQTACAGCPMGKGCDLLKCPNCGYEFPKGSKTVKFFTELFSKRRKKNDRQGH